MPVLLSYKNHLIDLLCKSSANQLTGFYMRARMEFNGLIFEVKIGDHPFPGILNFKK